MDAPTTSNPRRWPAVVFLLLGSVAVPGGAIALFQDAALRSPWLTLILLAIWEIGVLVAGFVTQVGSRLQSRWVDRATDRVDLWVTSHLSRYRRKYLRWLFYQHRDLDVKGLTTQGTYNLELEQVFVDLMIDPRPAHAAASDPVRPVPPELAGRRQIWDYLESDAIQGHLSLLGPPGSGKTTLLKKIALQMTDPKRPRSRKTIPILLALGEYAETIRNNSSYSLVDAARSALERRQGPPPPSGWFESQLEAGRCLVLLDGLDEVAAAEIRQRVVAWVETQMARWSRNQFLVTSRPHGYRTNPLAGVTVLEVQPFHREQIQCFVYNWYLANEIRASGKVDPGVEMKAHEGAEDLLRRLGNSQTLTDLAVNPLLLTMIANVHRWRSSLPGRRVELYAEICEVFLGKRQQARGMETDLTPAQKQRVLQPLAYRLMCTERREISITDAVKVLREPLRRVAGDRGKGAEAQFLKDVENTSGLLLERESQVYGFAHLAFQEYLAAVHAREQGLEAELVGKVAAPWWHETLRLFGAQGDASPIVAACLGSERPSIAALSLAIDCLEESREIDPSWRDKVDFLVREGVESSDPERFRLAAETLLARRLRDMAAVADGLFVDSTYVTHAEYQLFVDEMIAEGQYHQPDHWTTFHFVSGGSALAPVVGVRGSDAKAFCRWLNARDNTYRFRLPHKEELTAHGLERPQVPTAEGCWNDDAGVLNFFTAVAEPTIISSMGLISIFSSDLQVVQAPRAPALVESLADDERSHSRTVERAVSLDVAIGHLDDLLETESERMGEYFRQHSPQPHLDLDLITISNVSLGQSRSLRHFGELDRGRERARNHLLMLGLQRTLGRLLIRGRALDSKVDEDIELNRALDTARIRALGRDRGRADRVYRVRGPRFMDKHRRTAATLLWASRMITLYLALNSDPDGFSDRRRPSANRYAEEVVGSFDYWISVYTQLAVLEARASGNLAAIEGIRLVKERRG